MTKLIKKTIWQDLIKWNSSFAFVILVLFNTYSYSQELPVTVNEEQIDSTELQNDKKIQFLVDLASRYIWRGQSWGGDFTVLQPSISYQINEKWAVGTWATSNFKDEYYFDDGITSSKGYQEIDFYVSYSPTSFISVELWDYYWPTVEYVDGIDNGYFNYGSNGTKSVDFNVLLDFTELWIPINFTLSTLIAGNDFRFDENGENQKQNYTTYVELGYTQSIFNKKLVLNPVAGLVLNNEAEYYTSGDYDKLSWVNIGFQASTEFLIAEGLSMPLYLTYTHNAATTNTDFYGKNFLVAGMSLSF